MTFDLYRTTQCPRGLPGEEHDRWTTVDGLVRTYRLHVAPDDLDPQLPLVMALHHGRADAEDFEQLTGIAAAAVERGFVVVLPEAVPQLGYWDDGRFGVVDEGAFLVQVVEEVEDLVDCEFSGVNAVGFSNGASTVLKMAALQILPVTAVAAVGGTIGRRFADDSPRGSAVPMIYFHGTHDPFVYYYAGGSAGTWRGASLSVAEFGRWWSERNGGPEEPVEDRLREVGGDDTTVVRATYGAGDGEVVVYSILGGGHTWPGASVCGPPRLVGRTTPQLHATSLICDFFERHATPRTTWSTPPPTQWSRSEEWL